MSLLDIQALLAGADKAASIERTVSFLDSRYKDVDGLDNLELAASDAAHTSSKLQAKLSLSQSSIDALLSSTHSSVRAHLTTAQELSLLKHSIADELSFLSQELVSSFVEGEDRPTLLEDLESLHRDLKEQEGLRSYVQIIERVLTMSENAIQHIRGFEDSEPFAVDSLTSYRELLEFVGKVSQCCSTVEDGAGQQALHLVTFLQRVREKTWQSIKDVLSEKLLAAAEKLKWPGSVDYTTVPSGDRQLFEKAFFDLLKLQDIGRTLRHTDSDAAGLYPLQALVQPISLRFKYHFEGARQTNRLDKPEWYFTHVLNVAHDHRPFMVSVVQSLLSAARYKNIDAWDEFTSLLLPMLSRKLQRTIPTLLPHPSLLAHTIYQALAFDAALREEGFRVSRTSVGQGVAAEDSKWPGISNVILGRKEWFDAWMDGEKKFAEDQYLEIISASDAWLIADFDDEEKSSSRDIQPTNSARRIKAFVEQITDRYSPLSDLIQRTRFLSSVQLPLLEQYYGRILSSLDAFETLSSAFVRAVPGALGVSLSSRDNEAGVNMDTRRLTSGVEGVQRLCKALLSAKYIELAMEGWGEELFFLELWTEISHHASLRTEVESNPNLPKLTSSDTDTPQNTIFEGLVMQYRKLADRAENMVVQQISGEIEAELKAHFASLSSSNDHDQAADIAVSQTLLEPIALLSSHLTFLSSTLPHTTLTTVYRKVASQLAQHILQRLILYRGYMTLHEGKTVRAECELWVETCYGALRGMAEGGGRTRVEAPWKALLQAGRLVALEGEEWKKLVSATFGVDNEEEWRSLIEDTVGPSELGREEVGKILRCRRDCSL